MILKMKGHANAGKQGEDIICSAASMLVYTLAQNIKFLEQAGVAKDVSVILEEGNALVSCEPTDEADTLLCVFDSITTGFLLLSENYPDHVKFIEKN